MNEDIRQIKMILDAQARANGNIQRVDFWAAGSNDGGDYINLYNKYVNFRICCVYQEQFFFAA